MIPIGFNSIVSLPCERYRSPVQKAPTKLVERGKCCKTVNYSQSPGLLYLVHWLDTSYGLPTDEGVIKEFPNSNNPSPKGGQIMRFYNQQHKYYCGIDLHTRKMYVCIIDQI